MGEAETPSSVREDLKDQLFKSVDANRDGKLHKEEMRSLADLVGFEGSDAEWAVEYKKLCVEHGIEPASGIPQHIVMKLLEDRSESGCYCTTQELRELLGDLRGRDADAGADADPADMPGGAGAAKADGSEVVATSSTIFFTGAGYRTSEDVLRSTFDEAGTIQDFLLFRMSDGRSRGMGRVRFSCLEEAKRAVAVLNQQMVDGRRLLVKPDSKAEESEARAGKQGSGGSRQGPKQGRPAVGEKGASTEKGAIGEKGGGDRASGGRSSGSKAGAESSKGKAPVGSKGADNGRGAESSRGGEGGWDFGGSKPSGGKGPSGGHGGEFWSAVGSSLGKSGKDSAYQWTSANSWDEEATASCTVFFAGAAFETTSRVLRKHFEEAGRVSRFWLFQLKDGRSRGMGLVQYSTPKEARRAVQAMHGATIDGRELLVKADDVGALQAYEAYEGGGGEGSGSAWDVSGGWDEWGVEEHQGDWGVDWMAGGGKGGGGKGWDSGGGSSGSKGRSSKSGGKGGGWKGKHVVSSRVFFAGAPFSTTQDELLEYFLEMGEVRSFTLFRLHNGRSRGMGVCTFYSSESAAWALREGIVVDGRPLYLQEDNSLLEGGKGESQHEALATYGGGGRGKGQRAAGYQDYSSGYDYFEGDSGHYAEYDDWGYEAGHSSGAGRGSGRGAGRSHRGGSAPSASQTPVADPNKAVFFTKVPFGTTETHLRRLFGSVGKVKNFTLFTTTEGTSRGMGVVEYTTEASAERAYYELHETEVGGRPIVVDVYRNT